MPAPYNRFGGAGETGRRGACAPPGKSRGAEAPPTFPVTQNKSRKIDDRPSGFANQTNCESLVALLVFARLGAAHYQLAAQELLIVQFFHRAFGLINRLHLDEGKTFGSLIMPITNYLGILNMPDAVKQVEQVALGRVEGQISDVETRRRNFDRLGFTLRPWIASLVLLLLLLLMR